MGLLTVRELLPLSAMHGPHDNSKHTDAHHAIRVLVIAGSDRRQYNCPGVDSKARTLLLRMSGHLPPSWDIDVEDLGNVYGRDWPAEQDRDAYLPLLLQCRWSGIEVPEALRSFAQIGQIGVAQPYADNQAPQMMTNAAFISTFDAWTDRFAAFVQEKGTVPPGRYRAVDYRPPSHRWADVKLAWRDLRMRLGYPRRGSSPALQQAQGLNQDATQSPKRSEAKCHRL